MINCLWAQNLSNGLIIAIYSVASSVLKSSVWPMSGPTVPFSDSPPGKAVCLHVRGRPATTTAISLRDSQWLAGPKRKPAALLRLLASTVGSAQPTGAAVSR